MTRLYVVVEGQTEETFVDEVLARVLHPLGIFPRARLLGKPGHKGGDVRYSRVSSDVLTLLKQDGGAYCTTLVDFCGLGSDFPGKELAATKNSAQAKAQAVEQAVFDDISSKLGDARRFIPYVQMHEFEGLLFSDPEAFAKALYSPGLASEFGKIRAMFQTPEDIDEGRETAPSKRVLGLFPEYDKALNGPLAALGIGVERMRQECPHFNEWLGKLQALAKQP